MQPKFIAVKGKRALFLVFSSLLVVLVLVKAAGADQNVIPGSEGDPLVTASWVEAKMEAFAQSLKNEQTERQKLEDRMRLLEGNGAERPFPGEGTHVVVPVYEVVVVPEDKFILTGAGTEIILRTGKASAVEGPFGDGLSNLTSGVNLAQNDVVQRDHLIVSPRDDGRGIKTLTEAIFLIRGDYKIK
ncbi:MAG: hypothetical protein ACOX6X_08680 [Dethiobacteria bacterium]|jgi:hypothetical protein